jgi:ParB-like chromosome segregation protein Spo0J
VCDEVRNTTVECAVVSSGSQPQKSPQGQTHSRRASPVGGADSLAGIVAATGGSPDRRQTEALRSGCRRTAVTGTEGNPPQRWRSQIPCIVRDVDSATADALSLGENFGREAMHPLDEADAFAKLATNDGKDAEAIAAEFGVTERYVRQRMKLSTLAQPVKDAYRQGQIDTAMAEAFAAVPKDRQLDVWKEVNGNPRHAEHVRNVIAHAWIDSEHALFELSSLSDAVVSRDLFNERVLVERQAFMEAQANALESQRQALIEEGWNEVIVGRREDVQDRLYSMDTPESDYDEQTNRKLAMIAARREKLEITAQKISDEDEPRLSRLQQRYEALEVEEREVVEKATEHYSEETKAMATAFLILAPDGRMHREYRVPRRKRGQSSGSNGNTQAHEAAEKPKPPTSDDLSDAQRAVTFTHQWAWAEVMVGISPTGSTKAEGATLWPLAYSEIQHFLGAENRVVTGTPFVRLLRDR